MNNVQGSNTPEFKLALRTSNSQIVLHWASLQVLFLSDLAGGRFAKSLSQVRMKASWNFLKFNDFHDLFHDFSEFSMTKIKQFFSWQYQNKNIFSSITMHKMCAYFYWN